MVSSSDPSGGPRADEHRARLRERARRRTLLSFLTPAWWPIVRRVRRAAEGRLLEPARAPRVRVALVLGARVLERRPSAMLEDRLLTAVELWRLGKAERLLVSGTAEEVAVMTTYLAEQDVPGEAQLLDPRGRHTYESVLNARDAGHEELLIVSQAFHLPRALYLADALGLRAHGVPADLRPYRNPRRQETRELVSSVLAYWMAR